MRVWCWRQLVNIYYGAIVQYTVWQSALIGLLYLPGGGDLCATKVSDITALLSL